MLDKIHTVDNMQLWACIVMGSDVADVIDKNKQRITPASEETVQDRFVQEVSRYCQADSAQQKVLGSVALAHVEQIDGPMISDDEYSNMNIPATDLRRITR